MTRSIAGRAATYTLTFAVIGATAAGLTGAPVGPAVAGEGTPSTPGAPVAGGAGAPAVESAKPSLVGSSPVLPRSVERHSSARLTWHPERARYGTASHDNVAVTGAGGTTIRVDVIYPTTADGKAAKGRFPVVMTMTPYGKGSGGSSKPGAAPTTTSATGGANNYLVQRGYINVVMDVRGTGNSNGSWGLFDPIQQADAKRVLHYAAHLPHSDGRVGTYGPSYLGIDQLLLAGSVGKHSPLKAIFPVVPANDIYRDTSFMGGILDFEFAEAYLGLTGALNAVNPLGDTATAPQLLAQLAQTELDHTSGLASYHAAFTAKVLSGGPEAYDETYWHQRAVQPLIKRIVANRIPAYLVGGEFDIFQNGEPLDYAAFQNAWAHRPVGGPMRPHQRVTGRYQLIDGPWQHLNGSSVQLNRLQLRWFDTWLKHRSTGMERTPTPLHYYDIGTGHFRETGAYPFVRAQPHRLYFGAGKTLATTKTGLSGTDTVAWSPVGNPCGRPLDQWALGGVTLVAHAAGIIAPCAEDDSTQQLGGYTTSYTTAAFPRAATLAGPLSATIYASATTKETEWVTEVEMVTPSGASYPLTEGALLGSLRAEDHAGSWTPGGVPVYPFHPYTKASSQAVVPGKVTRYDVQIFPTLATIPKGDRLRVTVSTTDTPHLVPIPSQLAALTGGIYTIQHTAAYPSSLNVLLRPVVHDCAAAGPRSAVCTHH